INTILRHRGVLYTGGRGVCVLDAAEGKFIKEKNSPDISQCFQLISVGDELLIAAGDQGIYRLRNEKANLIKRGSGTSFASVSLHLSKIDNNRVFVGLFNGLAVLRKDPNSHTGWIVEKRINEIKEYIYNIQEAEPGMLWLGTFDRGTIRVNYAIKHNSVEIKKEDITHFGEKDGLVDGQVLVFKAGDRVIFGASAGFFYFDKDKDRKDKKFFSPALEFKDRPSQNEGIFAQDRQGNTWVASGKGLTFFKKPIDGKLKEDATTFQRIASETISCIYTEDNGITWFGGIQNIFRFDPNVEDRAVNLKDSSGFSTLIRRVVINSKDEVFGGTLARVKTSQEDEKASDRLPVYPVNTSIRFEFSIPSFINSKGNLFKCRLDDYENWSEWSKETLKDYTQLRGGVYRFLVRSKNAYGREGKEAIYSFRVLYPWYLRWWAYPLYFAFFCGLLVFIYFWLHARELKRRSQELEKIVDDRTSELKKEKENIEQLGIIGRDITAVLPIAELIETIYEKVNTLMDAAAFAIGIYHQESKIIDIFAKEKGETLPKFHYSLDDKDRPAVWCFKNQQEIFINDFPNEYKKYIDVLKPALAGEIMASVIYLPLTYKEKRIGVLTAQSFKKNAYTDYDLGILRNLAAYIAIAIANADAYKELNTALENLKSMQAQLIAQEKLASLGTLTAGVAHGINNPLNFVINFSRDALKRVEKLRSEMGTRMDKLKLSGTENLKNILASLEEDARKVMEHGKRMADIVDNLLLHSRGGSTERRP
ncbi:MAG: GAF domain-containing protein, partial [Candidatus Aminicenantes bacterium]|nr:GAF domain-containing protein [Candidatus Aminicenantes bacterium]